MKNIRLILISLVLVIAITEGVQGGNLKFVSDEIGEGTIGNSLLESTYNLELIDQIGGAAADVAVQGNYAYVALGSRLIILDITNSLNPFFIGESSIFVGNVTNVVVNGNYAYVLDMGFGLHILDISNQAQPLEIGYYLIGNNNYMLGKTYSLTLSDGFVFIGPGDGLLIVNVSQPSNPKFTSYYSGLTINDVKISGHLAFLAAGWQGLVILDLQDISHPIRIGSAETGYAYGVDLQSNLAIIADGVGADIQIFDISTPSQPYKIGFYDVYNNNCYEVDVNGSYAYLKDVYSNLIIFDISEPDNPRIAGHVFQPITQPIQSVVLHNGFGYIANYTGIEIFSLLIPDNILRLGEFSTHLSSVSGMAVRGNNAFIVSSEGLNLLDYTNPDIQDDQIILETVKGSKIEVDDQYIYNGGTGFSLFNIEKDPYNPIEIFVSTEASQWTVTEIVAREMEPGKKEVFISGSAFRVIDPSDPTNSLKEYPIVANGMDVSGNYAMFATTTNGYQIYDLSKDPPELIDTYLTDSPLKVKILGNIAYLFDNEGFHILNISDLSGDLTFLDEINLQIQDPTGLEFAVAQNFAYLLTREKLYIIDCSNPSEISKIGEYEVFGNDVKAVDGKVFIAASDNRLDYSKGLLVLQNSYKYSIAGIIKADNNDPIPNINLSSDSTHMSTTDAYGAYRINGLTTGTYTLRPNDPSWRFAPRDIQVIIPPNRNNIDFIARPMNPEPFLVLPFDYGTTDVDFKTALLGNNYDKGPGHVNSWFDHYLPYPYGNLDGNLLLWDGKLRPDPLEIDCDYGVNCYDNHNGIDFQHSIEGDETILAAADGKVVKNDYIVGYGNSILIDHHNGYATFYGHLKDGSIKVNVGDDVFQGQELAIMGTTGPKSWGIHLHFGLYFDQYLPLGQWVENEAVDPYGWDPSLSLISMVDPWTVKSHYLWTVSNQEKPIVLPEGGEFRSPSGTYLVNFLPGSVSVSTQFRIADIPTINPYLPIFRSIGSDLFFDIPNPGGISGSQISDHSDKLYSDLSNLSVEITGNFSNTNPHLDLAALSLFYFDDALNIWTPLESTINPIDKTVTAQTTGTGRFSMQAPLVCSEDLDEPNDGYDGSTTISPNGEAILGYFDITEDEDWYRFWASTGREYRISTDNLANGVDTIIELYETDGISVLATNDNFGASLASDLTWITPTTGTYFIRVSKGFISNYGCDASYEIGIAEKVFSYLPLITR